MKMIAEYLEHALQFERLAAYEENPEVKTAFEKQADAYRKLRRNELTNWGCSRPKSHINSIGRALTTGSSIVRELE